MAGNRKLNVTYGGDVSEIVQAASKAERSHEDIARSAKSAMAEAEGAVSKAADNMESNIKGFSTGAKAAFAAAGAAGGVVLGAAFVQSLDLEAGNDKLAAQLNLTEAESARVGGVAGKLYADAYGGSMEEVNSAVGAVMSSIEGMANASEAELQGATAKALDFAAAFDIDVTRAVSTAGMLLKNELAANATEAFDLITAASQQVPAQFREDVLDASDEYGQFFQALGFEGEQAFAVLVAGAQEGMYGIDKAGDAIKEFTIRATDMSITSQDAYKAIGLDAQTMANQILAGGDTAQGAFGKIVDGLLGIEDPATQANTAIALFGTPLEDLNVSQIPEFLTSLQKAEDGMGDVAGSAEKMGEKLNENNKTAFEGFKRGMEQNVTGVLGNVAGMLEKLPGPMQTVIQTAVGLGSMATPLVPLVALLPTIAGGFGLMAGGQTAGGVAAAGSAPGFWAAAAGIWATLAPILAVIAVLALIAGAVYLVVQNWDTIKEATGAAWDWVKEHIDVIVRGILAVLTGGLSEAVLWVVNNWDQIKAKTGEAWDWVKDHIGIALRAALAIITGGLSEAVRWVVNNWDEIKAKTGAAWDWVTGKISGAWNTVTSTVSGAVATVRDRISDGFHAVQNTVASAWDWVEDRISGAINGARDSVRTAIDNIKGYFQGLLDKVRSVVDYINKNVEKLAFWRNSPSTMEIAASKTVEGINRSWGSLDAPVMGTPTLGGLQGAAQASAMRALPAVSYGGGTPLAHIENLNVTVQDPTDLAPGIARELGWSLQGISRGRGKPAGRV